MDVLSKRFTNIFLGGEPTLWGGRNIDGVKLPFLFRDFVAPRVDPVGKKISQKKPIMRLQIEREKRENLGRNPQLVVEKKNSSVKTMQP